MRARWVFIGWTRYATLTAVLSLRLLVEPAAADVTSLGSVNPVPPTAGGTFTTTWVVGDEQASDSDFRAWVNIDDGTSLQYGSLIIGDEEEFIGEVNVSGDWLSGVNTLLTLSSSGTTNNPTVQVGLEGTGRLNINGATVNLSNSLANMSIGRDDTGVGTVSVSDPFAVLSIGNNVFVGDGGIGYLEVLNGGLVRTIATSSNRLLSIGTQATGVGSVLVEGTGSTLRVGSNLVVGGLGAGTLTIGDGGVVNANITTGRTTTVGPLGRVIMSGGTFMGQTPSVGFGTMVDGYLGGSGLVRGSVQLNDDSVLEAGPGDLLRFTGNVSNQGAATFQQADVHFLAGFTNNTQGVNDAPGRVSLQNSTVRFSQTLVNDGVISSPYGANNVHGEITNQGTIVVGSNSVATFHDAVTDNGGVVQVLQGGNALFLADLTFTGGSGALLSLDVDEFGATSTPIGVAGELTLAGDLTVDATGDYTPMLGDTFELFAAAGGVDGMFDNVMLPELPGMLEFGLIYNPTSVLMAVQIDTMTVLDGDFNGNNAVENADLTLLLNNWAQGVPPTPAGWVGSPPTSPAVDNDELTALLNNWGTTSGGGSIAVPEPSTLATCFLLVAFSLLRWRPRQSCRAVHMPWLRHRPAIFPRTERPFCGRRV